MKEEVRDIVVNESESTIRGRFKPPLGYVWESAIPGSFHEFLIFFPLKPKGFPLRDYRDMPLEKQYHHAAILDIDVGKKDLQQCADAWIRLYAEYLWSYKRYDEIEFEFTSTQRIAWNDYKKGVRTKEEGDSVRFSTSAKPDDTYRSFRNYLDLVFQYAGTISLDRETVALKNNSEIRVGDLIVQPGSPGHLVFIVGSAKNKFGKRVFLLAESFMPAQDIHVLKNPNSLKFSPWYELDIHANKLVTPKYLFNPVIIKRFHKE